MKVTLLLGDMFCIRNMSRISIGIITPHTTMYDMNFTELRILKKSAGKAHAATSPFL